MCGIVGLLVRNPKMRDSIGELMLPMLIGLNAALIQLVWQCLQRQLRLMRESSVYIQVFQILTGLS